MNARTERPAFLGSILAVLTLGFLGALLAATHARSEASPPSPRVAAARPAATPVSLRSPAPRAALVAPPRASPREARIALAKR